MSQTETRQHQPHNSFARHAAAVVPHLNRVELIRDAVRESGMRLRLCASRESLQIEERRLENLRKQGAAEILAARKIVQQSTDQAFLRDAAKAAIQREAMMLWEAEREAREPGRSEEEQPTIRTNPEPDQSEQIQEQHAAACSIDDLTSTILQERLVALKEIEQEVRDIGEISADIHRLVNGDQQHLDTIERTIEETVAATHVAVEQLCEAEKQKNRLRMRKMKTVLWGVAIVATLGLGLVIYKVIK